MTWPTAEPIVPGSISAWATSANGLAVDHQLAIGRHYGPPGSRQWGEQDFFAPGEPHSQLVDCRRGQRLRPLEVLSADGRRLNPDDTPSTRSPPSDLSRRVSADTSLERQLPWRHHRITGE
ncbi:hypothetical protein GCM10010270_78310 [Streptomyces violaceus]|nr:hypothetical protein GCM10010270_78310 [Streptomyces janthinus]